MYIPIGSDMSIRDSSIIGIFDLDNTTYSKHTRKFLKQAEDNGEVVTVTDDIPKSFLVCDHPYHDQIVYLSELGSTTLQKRMEARR